MSIAAQITNQLDTLTRSEARVAAHVLQQQQEVAFYTLELFAQRVGVSTTTVLRFCRRLGFSGFSDFQQAVRKELRAQPDLMEKLQRTAGSHEDEALIANTVNQGLHCIRQTFRDLPGAQIREAVERIAKAQRVFTFGMRESFALAHYAYTRFLTVRENVFLLCNGYSTDVEAVLSLTAADVCVVYLFHRYTRQALRILELLKDQGVQVILVTSEPCDRVSAFATVLLTCQVDAGGIKNSALAPVCLADLLCNAVAMTDTERTMRRMKQCETLFQRAEIL